MLLRFQDPVKLKTKRVSPSRSVALCFIGESMFACHRFCCFEFCEAHTTECLQEVAGWGYFESLLLY
jgi:hypothetical protein